MENLKIKQFLSVDFGDGWGDGWGDGLGVGSGSGLGSGLGYDWCGGSGDGWGDGSGDGWGDGSGDGWGDGSGDGSGDGWGDHIKSVNGESVYSIDGVPTIIRTVRGDFAKGFILREDLTLSPCYIAKRDGFFAHGVTLRKAHEALVKKLYENMPEEERIEAFVDAHKLGKSYPNSDFFEWHHRLTGSCEMGRREFAMAHDIDVDRGSMTVAEFIALTENDYGGDTIRKLRRHYECTN